MTLVRANTLAVCRRVPNLARAVVTRREQQMSSLWEELNLLDTSVVPGPCVQPLLRDEAVVLLVAQVAWRLHETFPSLVEDSSITVVDRCWVEESVLTRILHLCLRQSCLPLLLVRLHDSLLLLRDDATFLAFELFHTFVGGPGTLEIAFACLTKGLALRFNLALDLLLRLLSH